MTVEQELWQAVVLRAAMDALADNPSSDEDQRAKRDADRWFRFGGRDFREVCTLAGIDPDFIADAYKSGRIDRRLLKSKEVDDG